MNMLNSMRKALIILKVTIPTIQGITDSNIQSSSNKPLKYTGYFNVLKFRLLHPD